MSDIVTVTTPAGTFQPVTWMELETSREATNTTRDTKTGNTVVVHGPAPKRRTSTIVTLFDNETASRNAENYLAAGGVHQIAAPARPTHGMKFVVSGRITRALDRETAAAWILTFEVQEVLP